MAFDLDEDMADTLHTYLKQRAAEIGTRAAIHLYCATDRGAYWGGWMYLYRWPSDTATVHVDGKHLNVRDAVDSIMKRAHNMMDNYKRELITKLAHDVMDCMREFGECTPTRLRGKGHEQHVIDTYGARACEEAQTLADSGPFVITADDIKPNAPSNSVDDPIPF